MTKKRNTKTWNVPKNKSALRIEALEQRQLLATVTGSGYSPDSYQNIIAPNGNVYDQVLMTGSSVEVTADPGQITRVSYLDLSGDIIQTEFSGKGTLTISLDQLKSAAAPDKYNQPSVNYVGGLASFTIQGGDSSTNFGVFSIGPANANGGATSSLFADGKTGGNNIANVAKLLIVADPQNSSVSSSAMGGIRAGNAVFADTLGVVGISAINVNVQGPVIIGDIDASNSGIPSLIFGNQSQFATLTVAGGDLLQSNNTSVQLGGTTAINTINSQDGTDSMGKVIRSQAIPMTIPGSTQPTFSVAPAGGVMVLDTTKTFDLMGLTQSQIDSAFKGHTFLNAITINGDLASNLQISAGEFRDNVLFTGAIAGSIAVTNGVKDVTFAKGLGNTFTATSIGNITSLSGDITGNITAKSIGNVTVNSGASGGNLSGILSTDTDNNGIFTLGEKAIGNIVVDGNLSARVTGVLGIGNVTIKGNLTGHNVANGGGGFTTLSDLTVSSGSGFNANIGNISIAGDVNLKATTDTGANDANLISINRGTFGNITIAGAGALNSADPAVANYLGGINVINQLTSTSGTITIVDDASLSLGKIQVAGNPTLGAIAITSGSKAQTTTSTSTGTVTVVGNSITTAESSGDFTLSGITLAGAEVITLNTLQGRALNSVSATTIDTTHAVITLGGSINGVTSVGTVTLNAGVNGTVNVNNDIGGSLLSSNVTATAVTQTELATVGAVTISGNQVNFATNAGIYAKGGLTSLTVTGSGTAANAINFATPSGTASPNIEIGGTSGSITFNGNVAMNSTATVPTILANNGLSSLDSIAGITINGRVSGGGSGVGQSDIKASLIGNITIESALSQGQALVNNLAIVATNNASPTTQSAGPVVVAAVASNAETVLRDGSNLSGYSLGNITVENTNTIGVTGTQLFGGKNSFVGLGKIGNISLTGGGSAAVQTSLFGSSPAAGVGALFEVGDGDANGDVNSGIDFDGNGTIGTTTFNSAISGGNETNAQFSNVATATIGNILINAAGSSVTNTDSIGGIGGSTGQTLSGLRILAGVKASATGLFGTGDTTLANNIIREDANLIGTVGTITVTNLNQQLSVNGSQTAGFNGTGAATAAGVIAAAGSSTSTVPNFGAINGMATVSGTDFATANSAWVIGSNNAGIGASALDAGEIIVIRI